MDGANLIRMANRISEFFEAMPDRDEAREGVAQHLGRFWEPRMRRQLLSLAQTGEAASMRALLRETLELRGEALMPAAPGTPAATPGGRGDRGGGGDDA